MKYEHPHTIENGHGEKITFLGLVHEPDGDRLETEGQALPNAGPPMHVHYKQDEAFTVVQGKIGTRVLGEQPKFAGPGDSILFKAGIPHKFWNAGTDPLIIRGWIKPANNVEYFLTELYKSTAAHGGRRPGIFDSAWLTQRYRSEFEMFEIPGFVKNVVFPVVVFFGKLAGLHKKFAAAPTPL